MINLMKMPKQVPSCTFCPAGERYKVTYKYEYDEKHHCPRRVANGKIDLHDFIQASADDVDFKAIGKMLVDTRDNVIDHFKLDGEECDITRIPRNIHEYEALHNKMKEKFGSLPDDMKALFNNDFDVFRSSWQSGAITSVLDTYFKAGSDVPTSKDLVQKGEPVTIPLGSSAEGGND